MPAFITLESSRIRDKYVARTCQWRILEKNMIVVSDKNQPRVVTMDPWTQIIFLEATGDKTIYELVHYLAKGYTGKIPEELDETVINEIESLLLEGLIELKDEKSDLPVELFNPLA